MPFFAITLILSGYYKSKVKKRCFYDFYRASA